VLFEANVDMLHRPQIGLPGSLDALFQLRIGHATQHVSLHGPPLADHDAHFERTVAAVISEHSYTR
jgi:hypothetical protein